jgi:hypothetical protein
VIYYGSQGGQQLVECKKTIKESINVILFILGVCGQLPMKRARSKEKETTPPSNKKLHADPSPAFVKRLPTPFDEVLLPELWTIIREFVASEAGSMTRSLLALTCRAEFEQMKLERPRIEVVYSDELGVDVLELPWVRPERWFPEASIQGYGSICRWLYVEFPNLRSIMFPDYALEAKHYDIATMLDQLGSRCTPSIDVNLAARNNLKGLQWLVAHEYSLDRLLLKHCTGDEHLPMIQWLVEDQQHNAASYGCLLETLRNGAFKAAAYLADHGSVMANISSYFMFAKLGQWEQLDFLAARFPHEYAHACDKQHWLNAEHLKAKIARAAAAADATPPKDNPV